MWRFTLLLVAYLFGLCVAGPVNLTMPSQCAGMDFCRQKHPNYPEDRINEILEARIHLYQNKHIDMAVRIGNNVDGIEETVCEPDIDLSMIYEIMDTSNRLRFVVQAKNFSQRVRTEICLEPGRITSDSFFRKDQLDSYNIRCVQETIDYKLLVLTEDLQGFELASVRKGIPVACVCRID